MFWKKKNKKGPPLVADSSGTATITLVGTPMAGEQKVVVTGDAGTVLATVMDDNWYHKVLALQSNSGDQGWKTVTFGLDQEQAQILGAALLGFANAEVAQN